jgi:hypothetical protein
MRLVNADGTFRLAGCWFESIRGIHSLTLLALQGARRMEDVTGYSHVFSVDISTVGFIFLMSERLRF